RYINCGIAEKLSASKIKAGLERDLVGYEIDASLVESTRAKLNRVASELGVGSINWNLMQQDYLSSRNEQAYSFIVGNPPYLEYKAIDATYRQWLKEAFSSCNTGKFDYCYAFIEKAIRELAPGGTLVQLVPVSIFKNVFAKTIREELKPDIDTIIDFASESVFYNALVSPCVFRFRKGNGANSIAYKLHRSTEWNTLPKSHLGGKWYFGSEAHSDDKTRFGTMFAASMPVATLCNDAFLVADDSNVEDTLVRDAFAPRSSRIGRRHRIIFPYRFSENNEIEHYSESDFEKNFPHAVEHLRTFESRLEARKADTSAAWFEYGRSQGLRHVPEKKLLISTVVTGEVTAYELDEDTVPFAGIVITGSREDSDLGFAKQVIESKGFSDYARKVGTSISGSSVRITCRDVENYWLDMSG
ncbi:MAG: hypothetical protein IJ087_19850, partial [Eggerthellaceae bacterium]|nr:hypothetical protein [Eggerthellaceae bacterium]